MKINLFNLFTCLKENKIYAEARAKVADLVKAKKDELKALVEEYVREKSPAVKEGAISFIMDHIELKFPYKLFKGTIRKTLEKNFDKIVEFILIKIQEV